MANVISSKPWDTSLEKAGPRLSFQNGDCDGFEKETSVERQSSVRRHGSKAKATPPSVSMATNTNSRENRNKPIFVEFLRARQKANKCRARLRASKDNR